MINNCGNNIIIRTKISTWEYSHVAAAGTYHVIYIVSVAASNFVD